MWFLFDQQIMFIQMQNNQLTTACYSYQQVIKSKLQQQQQKQDHQHLNDKEFFF